MSKIIAVEGKDERIVTLSPNDASLLFLLAANPSTNRFDELSDLFENDAGRNVGRVLVGLPPEPGFAQLHAVLQSVANELAKRTHAARAERRAAVAAATA